MTRTKAVCVALAVVVLLGSACSDGEWQARRDPERIRTLPYTNLDLVTGGGASDLIGVVYTDVANAGSTGFRATLQLFRHDPAYPDDLVDLGQTYLGVDTLYHRVVDAAVTSDWAAVTINYNEAPVGWVALVSIGGPTPVRTATLLLSSTLDRAIAAGRWLLVAAGAELALLDLADPANPVLVPTGFVAGSSITCLVPAADGFLAFTSGGYVRVDPDAESPTFTETTDEVMRNFRKAFPVGAAVVLAGPSTFAGKSRVVRVDVAGGNPELVHSSEYEGNFVDFAFDGDATAVLQTTAEWNSDDLSVLHERAGGFDASTTPTARWYWGPTRLAARSRRLYGAEPEGVALYRLP